MDSPDSPAARLSGADVKQAALGSGFTLAGLARAEPLDPAPLSAWLSAGHHADMDWMARRTDERLDPRRVLPGARTVLALALAYHRPAQDDAAVARYARGRDYHYTHRDRMRRLRRALLALSPGLETYACVDTGVAMEKVWAERAGLGFIGKNGCLINPRLGSWFTLSVMFFDRAVDEYDEPCARACGDCRLCLDACPTAAFAAPGVVDARRCIAYQSIENRGEVPAALATGFAGRVFGCDVCQEVCPYNRSRGARMVASDPQTAARPVGLLPATALLRLTRAEFADQASGTPLMRAGHDGIRRNAALAAGAAGDEAARPVLERLGEDPVPAVAAAARWALARLSSRG